ncbi:hypothetical protein EB001_09560 [bacterium]|nr:hypothetical protein [bacterium]
MAQKITQKALDILNQKAAKGIPVSSSDSLMHQYGKMFDFENTMGGFQGQPVANFGYNLSQLPYNLVPKNWAPPKTKEEAINLLNEEMGDRLKHYSSAMEKGEAADFIFNTGRDPRVYMLDQFLKSKGQVSGLPERGLLNKNIKSKDWTPQLQSKLDSIWDTYKDDIMKLKENERRVLMNKGRDDYYKNTYRGNPGDGSEGIFNWGFDAKGNPKRGADGSLSPAYGKTWGPRIWKSVNKY